MDILHLAPKELFKVGKNVRPEFPLRQLRKLDCFCIFFVSKGEAQVEIDFYQYKIKEKSVLFLSGNSFFQCIGISDDFTVFHVTFGTDIWIEVTALFDFPFFAFLKKYPHFPAITGIQGEKYYYLFNAIEHVYHDKINTFRNQIFKNFLQNLLLDLYDNIKKHIFNNKTNDTPKQEELLGKFVILVFEHSSSQRDVKFYADEMCITTRYLSSIVQKLTGMTPKSIIDSRCVQEMKMLLSTTRKSVQEIAFQMNFPDQSIFSRYFRKHTNMSPLEYRAKQMK